MKNRSNSLIGDFKTEVCSSFFCEQNLWNRHRHQRTSSSKGFSFLLISFHGTYVHERVTISKPTWQKIAVTNPRSLRNKISQSKWHLIKIGYLSSDTLAQCCLVLCYNDHFHFFINTTLVGTEPQESILPIFFLWEDKGFYCAGRSSEWPSCERGA